MPLVGSTQRVNHILCLLRQLNWLRDEVERRGRENEELKTRLNAAADLRVQEAEVGRHPTV